MDTTFTGAGQLAILVTALVTMLTTFATLIYNFVREGRRHRWEEEAARRHLETTAKAEKDRREIAERVRVSEVNLNAKLDENTEISRKAFNEANHVNDKLAVQAASFDRLLAVALSASEKRTKTAATARGASDDLRSASAARNLQAVKVTVDSTADQVSDIHRTVVEHDDG